MMKNKKLIRALACLSLLACQQLMALTENAKHEQPFVLDFNLDQINLNDLLSMTKLSSSNNVSGSLTDTMFDGLATNNQAIKPIGYYDYRTCELMSLFIPKLGYSLELNFFPGSGKHAFEHYMPFPFTKIEVKNNDTSAVMRLGNAFLQNDYAKTKQGLPSVLNTLAKKYVPEELKAVNIADMTIVQPRLLFLIKLAMLVNLTLNTNDLAYFTQELQHLVTRLLLSDDTMFDEESPISGLCSPAIAASLDAAVPSLLSTADHIFKTTKTLLKTTKPTLLTDIKTVVFIFHNNRDAGREFAAYAKTIVEDPYALTLLDEQLTLQALNKGSWQDICTNILSKAEGNNLDPESMKALEDIFKNEHLVSTFEVSGSDAPQSLRAFSLLEENDHFINQAGQVQCFEKGLAYIVCVSTDKAYLNDAQVAAAVLQLGAAAWNNYFAIMAEEVEPGTTVTQEDLLLNDLTQQERAELIKFLQSPAAASLKENLEKIQIQLFGSDEEKVEQNIRALEDKRDMLELSLLACVDESQKNILESTISTLNQQISALRNQVTAVVVDNDLEKIATLNLLLAQREDADVRAQLESLVKKIAVKKNTKASAQALVVNLDAQQRIALRASVLNIYEAEFANKKQELADLLALCDDISTDEIVQDSALAQKGLLALYVKYLNAHVNRRKDQQKKLAALGRLKKAIENKVLLTADDKNKLDNLIRELDFVFTAQSVQEICRVTKPTSSLTQQFIDELSREDNNQNARLNQMRQDFYTGITMIFERSQTVFQNQILVDEVLNFLPKRIIDKIITSASRKR